jgi:signal transduction histidine kinase
VIDELRPIDLLSDLRDEELLPWARAADRRDVAAGEVLVDAGAEPLGLVLLLEGTIEGLIRYEDGFEPEVDHVAPTWLGAIPTLLRMVSPIRMVAREDVCIAVIEPDSFRALVLAHPPVFDRIMAQVSPVLGRFEGASRTRERLVSLGTMAAGLAHELNNPATAASRASAALGEALEQLPALIAALMGANIRPDDLAALPAAPATGAHRSALAIADAEDALLPTLEELSVTEPWRLAASLAVAGVDGQRARELVSRSGPVIVEWLAFLASSRQAAADLAQSTQRVGQLVDAMRRYTHLDREPLGTIDIHDGLDATLAVVGARLALEAVTVSREYAHELPKIQAYPAELNQVWTHLIENAAAAITSNGTITIATRLASDCVEVDITDDGPGISPDIQARVFDPFFTTRTVGQGVGLGLHTARQIIAVHHSGTLTVSSQAGRTTFRARLPLAVPVSSFG